MTLNTQAEQRGALWRTAIARRSGSAARGLTRLGPLIVALGVAKGLLDYLPSGLSANAMRYLLAIAGALAAGCLTALAGLVLDRRRRREESYESSPVPAMLSENAREALLDCQVVVDDPAAGLLTGWSHFIEEARIGVRPTAIGTAYGLKICLTIDSADGRPDCAALATTLWRLQLPDGGWAARTQTRIGRPEVTALVLGALSRSSGDMARLASAVRSFELTLDRDSDPEGMARTYVVSSALSGLLRFAPDSPRVTELRRSLISGAIRDPGPSSLLCWADELSGGQNHELIPSVPHTARAVIALARAARVHPADNSEQITVREALQWLVRNGGVEPQTEQIRRVLPDDQRESLTVRHFTAAWVAKALLCGEAENRAAEGEELLRRAIRRVWGEQDGGIWRWGNGQHPLWMTYQGLTAVRAHLLSTGTRP
ncbi:MAG TPA: hypothetical protein VFU43_00290 [Streptosporangiaceae bacterium]|nr:hypothetical protein [Streptosporangiaceae bacterium]